MICLCFLKMDDIHISHWFVCVFNSISDGERLTKSIRKHSCVLDSDNFCSNRGNSLISTSFIKPWKQEKDFHVDAKNLDLDPKIRPSIQLIDFKNAERCYKAKLRCCMSQGERVKDQQLIAPVFSRHQ